MSVGPKSTAFQRKGRQGFAKSQRFRAGFGVRGQECPRYIRRKAFNAVGAEKGLAGILGFAPGSSRWLAFAGEGARATQGEKLFNAKDAQVPRSALRFRAGLGVRGQECPRYIAALLLSPTEKRVGWGIPLWWYVGKTK